MENLMIPVIPANEPAIRPDVRTRSTGRADKSSSFSDYLEKKMVAEPRERKNLLGTGRNRAEKVAAKGAEKSARSADKGGDEAASSASIHALLGQFLAEIRSQANAADAGPGAWTLTLPDASQLVALAQDAGMSEAQTAALLQQFEANQGTLELDSLLATLVSHFQASQNEQPVTVPETELPFLDLILERMGVPAEKIQQIGEQAVTGDNQLDLVKFLAALQDVQADQPTTLDGWEAEQLQNLLDEAGVSKFMQRALLPERHTPWEDPNQALKPVTLTMDRLREMLSQGMQDIADHQRTADIPGVLNDLKAIFAEAGFAEKGVGWTPAVQKAVEETYQSLLQNVDLATVQVKKVAGAPMQAGKGEAKEENFWEQLPADDAAAEPVSLLKAEANAQARLVGEAGEDLFLPAEQGLGQEKGGLVSGQHDSLVAGGGEVGRVEQQAAPHEAKSTQHLPRLNPALEQQTMERISAGVIRGLRANEQHLVLRLYPKELGEVKVEMMVRDNHVALSFAMENSRVKEVLEKHMDMFQQNMEQQGFTLEECMVSVNQQRDGNSEAWREFVQGWQERRGEGAQPLSLAEVGGDALYLRPGAGLGRETGIDFFA